MPIPQFIDGVLVYHDKMYGLKSSEYPGFSFHRYSFPNTALKPGAFSPSICALNRLLGIRILYMHIPLRASTTRNIDPEIASFFFRHWLYDRARSQVYWERHFVFFRDDFKPLHPKQAEVLWRFCDRLFLVIDSPLVTSILPQEFLCMRLWVKVLQHPEINGMMTKPRFEELSTLMRVNWMNYCTVDNFNAFFELYRRDKLLKGDSCWRDVKFPCDVCDVEPR